MLTRWLIPIVLFAAAGQPSFGPIRFEDATKKSGIAFTHSFGAREVGLAAGKHRAPLVWLDYNNDGNHDLYVISGRPFGPDPPIPAGEATDAVPPDHPTATITTAPSLTSPPRRA